ncbi:MAG: family 43 glycosylhydrolase [Rhodopirellula sp.]|nr:family 43 glycosylhydrolase [Rhodopirellula sp.]
MFTSLVAALSVALCADDGGSAAAPAGAIALDAIPSPVIFRGDAVTAYRDPAAVYHNGVFHLFFTLVRTEPDGKVFSYAASSKSRDLVHWTAPRAFTPRDRSLNFSSPGNIVRFDGRWVLCLQTYPRPKGEKYGNENSRLWIMRSDDLEHWSRPEMLRVKGDVATESMGRMIDPYLLEDKDEPGKWWCFYKQNGVSRSWSRDLEHWTFTGSADAGENVCVIVDRDEYVLFHSPHNGIGMKRSADLNAWRDCGVTVLGQPDWPWARHGRLTAGCVLDLRRTPAVGKAIMFFHASEKSEDITFDTHCHLGLAWSDDLQEWQWPEEKR